MKRLNILLTIILILSSGLILSCKKGYLDKRSNVALVVPETLDDMQKLLDADRVMNGSSATLEGGPVPSLGELASDNYYMLTTDWQNFWDFRQTQTYIWASNVFNGTVPDWNNPYRGVFYANIVLENLQKIEKSETNKVQWNNVKGSALFFRAHAFYQLLQVFAKHYDKNTANTDLGIPLRLTSDINEQIERSTVKQSYDKIISDLEESIPLLPSTPLIKTRPSKPAAFGLLARIYLNMEEYSLTKVNCDSCLNLYSELLDYNNSQAPDFVRVTSNTAPFQRFNREVIFHALAQSQDVYLTTSSKIDTALFDSYDINDLRRAAFFRISAPGYRFKGNYDGSSTSAFAGIATDEIYLIRAECNARLQNVSAAMDDLNTLMIKRWSNNGTFQLFTATDESEALNKILTERRKELLFRGLRWVDLRRLNAQGSNITLYRQINGQDYTLPAQDKRWIFPIPPDVINSNPSMQQNPR